MAMLAPKPPYPLSLGSQASSMVGNSPQMVYPPPRKAPVIPASARSTTSPTNSDKPIEDWDLKDVCHWLRTHRCGEYEAAFNDNHITGKVLLELDRRDLVAELKVTKVGPLRILLSFIEEKRKDYVARRSNQEVLSGVLVPASHPPSPCS